MIMVLRRSFDAMHLFRSDANLTATFGFALLALGVNAAQAASQSTPNVNAAPSPQQEETPAPEAAPDAAVTPETAQDSDPDNAAASLNAQQQLQQSFTFTRTINGEVVETQTRTVIFDKSTPVQDTEAGASPVEKLKTSFDLEALTRTEAYEEAKLDFALADIDRDGALTSPEFVRLAGLWREADNTSNDAPRVDAWWAKPKDGATIQSVEEAAQRKFMFMAGAAETLDLTTYIREVLTDFDAMDDDNDGILRDDPLISFRAAIAGYTVKM